MSFPRYFADDSVFFGERTKKGRKALPPLRTFTEMADEFGLTVSQLRWNMSNSAHSPPEPKIRSKGNLSRSNYYYEPAEVRAWWKLHLAV